MLDETKSYSRDDDIQIDIWSNVGAVVDMSPNVAQGGSEYALAQLVGLDLPGLCLAYRDPRDAKPLSHRSNHVVNWRSSVPEADTHPRWVYCTDADYDDIRHPSIYEHLRAYRATYICVSAWQAARVRARDLGPTVVIPPFVDPRPVGLEHRPKPGRYCYVGAVSKGLPLTLQIWNELALPDAELIVATNGWDRPSEDSEWPANVTYLGAVSPRQVWDVMADCEAMFYVNTMPETFGVLPHIASSLGLRTHILTANGIGGVFESTQSRFVSGNGTWWAAEVRHLHRTCAPQELLGPLPDCRAERLRHDWARVLLDGVR